MEALEGTMKKHNINLDFPSSSYGQELSTSIFSFNATYTSSSYE